MGSGLELISGLTWGGVFAPNHSITVVLGMWMRYGAEMGVYYAAYIIGLGGLL